MFDTFSKIWIPTVGGAILAILFDDERTLMRSVTTVLSAIFMAHFFTLPVLNWLNLDPEVYLGAIAGLLALTGYKIMRWLLKVSDDPIGTLKKLRGSK